MQNTRPSVRVYGAGLAGCEAAWQAALRGVEVYLYEMKPTRYTPAHHYAGFAELVCSNSLRSDRVTNAVGLLKEELSRMGSLIMEAARATQVAAGSALAVDRELFSGYITRAIRQHPRIRVEQREATQLPETGVAVIASGPLTSEPLAESIRQRCGGYLSFFDAAAPIVSADSVDMAHAFAASRYDREESGEGDYLNCPLNKEEYEAFHAALVAAETAPLHEFDKNAPAVYEGCMPIEVLARRGADTIRFGPMKPVGLRDPRTGHRPWAVVQLRRENAAGTMLNLVGFQTNLKFGEQKRVFGMIPALHDAEFLRYGVMHRNTFLNSPQLLTPGFALKDEPRLFFAGQMTGVEGYMESAASGILAGLNAVRALDEKPPLCPSEETMLGALSRYVCALNPDFQPMGANFGVLPPLSTHIRDKKQRYAALSARALASFDAFCAAVREK